MGMMRLYQDTRWLAVGQAVVLPWVGGCLSAGRLACMVETTGGGWRRQRWLGNTEMGDVWGYLYRGDDHLVLLEG